MFERISNGWNLTKQSFAVLRAEKSLLIFPFVSGLACLLVLASFAAPLWMTGTIELLDEHGRLDIGPWGYAVMFAFYFCNYFVIVFFNSALVACAVLRFGGDDPTPADGLRVALARLPQIVGWALVAASVGVLLRAIESRSEKFGSLVASLLGMAWSTVTYFVVPVIVVEKAGPISALERSTAILRKAWGESLTANVGIGAITSLLCIPAVLVIFAGAAVISVGQVVLGGAIIGVGALAVLIVSLVSSAASAIVLAALYLYGATDRVPDAFDPALLHNAFAPK
ncbi:MAG: DUF6159 family protein [Pirellulales bacterium]